MLPSRGKKCVSLACRLKWTGREQGDDIRNKSEEGDTDRAPGRSSKQVHQGCVQYIDVKAVEEEAPAPMLCAGMTDRNNRVCKDV